MSGKSVAHDSVEGNITISVSGKVTYTKSVSQIENPTPSQFRKELQKMRSGQKRFTLYAAEQGERVLMDTFPNVVIADAQVDLENYSDTIMVSLTFEQVFVSKSATAGYLPPIKASADKSTTGSPEDNGDGTGTDKGTEPPKTLYKKGFDAFVSGE